MVKHRHITLNDYVLILEMDQGKPGFKVRGPDQACCFEIGERFTSLINTREGRRLFWALNAPVPVIRGEAHEDLLEALGVPPASQTHEMMHPLGLPTGMEVWASSAPKEK